MHNCDVAAGDAFLSRTVPGLLRAVGPRGAVFVTWDLSILRTIEDAWGLPRLGQSACRCTPVIGDIWRRGVVSGRRRRP